MLFDEYLKQRVNVVHTTFAISCAWAKYIYIYSVSASMFKNNYIILIN